MSTLAGFKLIRYSRLFCDNNSYVLLEYMACTGPPLTSTTLDNPYINRNGPPLPWQQRDGMSELKLFKAVRID